MPGSQYFKWTRSAGAHRQGQELPRPAGPRWFGSSRSDCPQPAADLQASESAPPGMPLLGKRDRIALPGRHHSGRMVIPRALRLRRSFRRVSSNRSLVSRTCDSTIPAARSISHALKAAMMARCSAQP
ncbi:hypothetical protein CSB85_1036 [Pseudomonas aeruginosa]|nr:hypothetical protein CSB97_1110 [Pseudomonas aeruginosa]CCQ85740.1 hypothetical protein PA18A_2333 [Pseudomonas aeruginosa 18A]SMZ50272.1 hypothetical protein PANN_24350 [Pseudomonas aeruginosa C-NN2]GAJ51760.1 hypothetical protein RBRAMI_0624 [Pseudomonas aeruginosa RB]AVK29166.1 hypothetical protein CSB85_1036 [Pseudomonas aeruginosa]